jgi:perosamine synthetase
MWTQNSDGKVTNGTYSPHANGRSRAKSRIRLVQPVEVTPEEMGADIAEIVPCSDPVLGTFGDPPRSIRVCEPTICGNERKYVNECLDSNWISSAGGFIPEFESKFAAVCHARHGIACVNGTAALHLAVATMDIGPGDEVILPAFTMIATINAVAYTGATPVLVDAEPETWNMDMNQVEDKITPNTRLVIPVHTYGHPADMDPLMQLAERHGFAVLEDAAEAHGASYRGRKVGSLGHAAAFSFYANKNITTGEGGMVVTDDADFARVCRNLRDHAFSTERHFWHKYRGFNYRMTNLQAALGVAQVERFDDLVARRRANAARYSAQLTHIPGITTPPQAPDVENVYWMYAVLVNEDFGLSRNQLREYLAAAGIETRSFFIPLHLQPIYWQRFFGQRFPVAEKLCRDGFYYPSSASLLDDYLDYIVEVTRRAYTEAAFGAAGARRSHRS